MTQLLSLRARTAQPKLTGFTLTEVAIVVAIIGLILGAIWVAAAMVYENNRSREASVEVVTIVNNWKSIYGSKLLDLSEGTDMTLLTIRNGFAPTEMITTCSGGGTGDGGGTGEGGDGGGEGSGGDGGGASLENWLISSAFAQTGDCLQGAWSGSVVTITSYQSVNALGIQYASLSKGACNHLGNSLAGTAGLVSTTINGTTTNYPPVGTATPLTASAISTQCNAAGTANSVLAKYSMN